MRHGRHTSHPRQRATGHRVEIDAPLVGSLDVRSSRVPRVELDRRHLDRPDDRRQLGHAQLVGVQPVAGEVDADRLQPPRHATGHPLLVDLLAAEAGRETVQHARPLAEGVHDARTNGEVVVRQVQLRRPRHREVHAIRVRDPDGPVTDEAARPPVTERRRRPPPRRYRRPRPVRGSASADPPGAVLMPRPSAGRRATRRGRARCGSLASGCR